MAHEHLGLIRWPFPVVPDRDFCGFIADRKQLRSDVGDLLKSLGRQEGSSIHLLWSWFGAGKTHTLYYIANRSALTEKSMGGRLHAVYSEFPKSPCEACRAGVPAVGWPACSDGIRRCAASRSQVSTIRGRLGQREPAEPPDYELGLERIVRPLPGWLPDGLFLCRDCGKVRGTALRPTGSGITEAWKSTCLCEGLTCRQCGRRRVPRPVSDYFDPVAGGWWHVPYFVGMSRTCHACNREQQA